MSPVCFEVSSFEFHRCVPSPEKQALSVVLCILHWMNLGVCVFVPFTVFRCTHSCHKSYYAMKSVEGGTAESVRLRNKLRESVCGLRGFNSNPVLNVLLSAMIPSYLV